MSNINVTADKEKRQQSKATEKKQQCHDAAQKFKNK